MKDWFSKKVVFILFLQSFSILIEQFIIMIQNRIVSIPQTILKFFCFFTILTNILVALSFSFYFFEPKKTFSFFTKPNFQTTVAVYIFIVAFVYNIILRFLWNPKGLQQIVGEFLHLIIPLIYLLFWYFKVDKSVMPWNSFLKWMLYPLLYLLVILFLGSLTNYYPYPFINITVLGKTTLYRNIFILTLFFGLISLIFIGISKIQYMSKI